jgi:hypothetical protein
MKQILIENVNFTQSELEKAQNEANLPSPSWLIYCDVDLAVAVYTKDLIFRDHLQIVFISN